MIHKGFLKVDSKNQVIEIPFIEVEGKHAGRNLVVVAGLHGDEYDAISAIFKVFPQINVDELFGRIIFITIGNPLAFANQTRETSPAHLGGNLARLFPGNLQGTPTEMIAKTIWDFIIERCTPDDLVLDLHSGGQFYHYARMAGVRDVLPGSPQTTFAELAARAMKIDNLWIMDATPGTLSYELILKGIPAIGCEVKGLGIRDEDEVQVYVEGLKNVMRLTKHIKGEPELTSGEFSKTITIYSSKSGFAVELPQTHRSVNKGNVICRITDGVGTLVLEIHSPISGEIWASRTNPSIKEGDIIALIKVPNI